MAPPRTTFLRGDRLVNVAGESHYQEALRALAPAAGGESVRLGTEAVLVPEPDNPHDANAVRVEIAGSLVGYLPRAEAAAYAAMLAGLARRGRAAACEAVIAGRGDESGTSNLGVFLKLPEPGESVDPPGPSRRW